MSHTAELDKLNKSGKRIYLDYAATTPIDPEVLERMLLFFSAAYSNPSSMHTSGRNAKRAVDASRESIATVLNCLPQEIIFTGSGTESDNMAMLGIARAYRNVGNHIIISAIEHKAIIEPVHRLEKQGFRVSVVPVDSFGMIDVDGCVRLVCEDTILVSVMYANNEIGTIEPIRELAQAIKKVSKNSVNGLAFPLIHTDACQAAGALSLDVRELGVDLMTINSSKVYGPKGVGALYIRKGISIEPLILGGEQERNLRAGTESVPLIAGFAHALTIANKIRAKESNRLIALQHYFIKSLVEKIPQAVINGHRTERLPNNVHISIPHIEGESILLMLDDVGIEASTGSACSAYDLKPSHVLLAIGQTAEFAHGSIRFSLGRYTTKKDINYVLKMLPPIVKRLSSISALTTQASRHSVMANARTKK